MHLGGCEPVVAWAVGKMACWHGRLHDRRTSCIQVDRPKDFHGVVRALSASAIHSNAASFFAGVSAAVQSDGTHTL